MKDRLIFAGKSVELSENSTYLTVVNRICYYGEPNLNGVQLPKEDAEKFAQTLVDMPVYAKYMVNDKGEPSFGGHEAYLDEDGNVAFDTVPIGVHTSVEIKDDDVEIEGTLKTLPCLFATQKVWKRNKNATAAAKRLYEEGRLFNSWEIVSNSYTYENGIKTLTDYAFEGNCYLGVDNGHYPAYGGSSKVISLSGKENSSEMLIAEAVAKDVLDQSKEKEGDNLNPEKVNTSEVNTEDINLENPNSNDGVTLIDNSEDNNSASTDNSSNNVNQISEDGSCGEEGNSSDGNCVISAVTYPDIYRRLENALNTSIDGWGYLYIVFPEEHVAWAKTNSCKDELDFVEINYSMDGDEITIVSMNDIKLVSSPRSMSKTIDQLTSTLAQSALQITELQKYKEKYDEIQKERVESERLSKISELKQYVEDSQCFSEGEINSDEISELINTLNKPALAEIIADRTIEKARRLISKSSNSEEVSSKNRDVHEIKTNLSSIQNESDAELCKNIMKNFLYR